MSLAAFLTALLGVVLKAIAAQPAGWFLVPLAAVAGICHVIIHSRAAKSATPPGRLAVLSNILLLGAVACQIDFGSWNCGLITIDGVMWRLGLSAEKPCTLIRGLPAILLDLALYIPVVVSWWRLRAYK